ncbi:MAG: glycosyltransferase family 39 protein [Marmoricola sp.]
MLAALTTLVLVLLSGRYGYHRDELYFLACGRHLAWGYPDQPSLVPLLARLAYDIAPGSLVVLRLPSALAAGVTVILAGAMARELGARRSGVWLASGATSLGGFVLATGHLLSTSTFALLGTTAATYALVRLLRGNAPSPPAWLALGLIVGITLEASPFPVVLLTATGFALLAVGPREVLRGPWPWVAVLVAIVIVSPYAVWQAHHGWPQIDVARGISGGSSVSSVSRPLFLPFLLLQAGPWLAAVWVPGLVRVLRDPRLRCLGVGFLVATGTLLVVGGKPYYVGGWLPLLVAAGAQPVVDVVQRRWIIAGLVLSSPILVFSLPVLPVAHAHVAVSVNPDAGETIGWPQYANHVVIVLRQLPPGTPVVTDNYGEAGALARFGPSGLRVYSGHNAYASWGHPPGRVEVLLVGVSDQLVHQACETSAEKAVISSPHGIENGENGTILRLCNPTRRWTDLWPLFSHT